LAALDAPGGCVVTDSHSAVINHEDDDGGEWEVVTRRRDQAFASRSSCSKATVLPGWYNGDDDEAGWIGPASAKSPSVASTHSAVLDQPPCLAPEQESASAADAVPAAEAEAVGLPSSPCVRVVTADFAMQNVLLQIGIRVVGTGGRMVRGVKTFVLKCHSCFKICMDATREFCPHCGNHTMMKVRCIGACFLQ
jgi:RNA-binding protein NOB1